MGAMISALYLDLTLSERTFLYVIWNIIFLCFWIIIYYWYRLSVCVFVSDWIWMFRYNMISPITTCVFIIDNLSFCTLFCPLLRCVKLDKSFVFVWHLLGKKNETSNIVLCSMKKTVSAVLIILNVWCGIFRTWISTRLQKFVLSDLSKCQIMYRELAIALYLFIILKNLWWIALRKAYCELYNGESTYTRWLWYLRTAVCIL